MLAPIKMEMYLPRRCKTKQCPQCKGDQLGRPESINYCVEDLESGEETGVCSDLEKYSRRHLSADGSNEM